jgi:transposase
LAYLSVVNGFAVLRLLPGSDRDKDAETLALRHQLAVVQRQPGGQKIRFSPADRALLAALLHHLPRPRLRNLTLLVRPDTILRWHRDLIARRHAAASRPPRRGRPPTVGSVRALVLRLARENPTWRYRRIHGELLVLAVTVAPSTVWQILRQAGIDPAPERSTTTWATFLRSQAEALLAADFIETVTLTGTRRYILAVIEHASRRVRILGATANPTAAWVTQAARNLVMDREDTGCRVKFFIRDRDAKYPPLFDAILADAGHPDRAQRCPDAPHELDLRALGAHQPPRTAGPDADLEPTAPTARVTPVRGVLQRPSAPPGHRRCPTPRAAA